MKTGTLTVTGSINPVWNILSLVHFLVNVTGNVQKQVIFKLSGLFAHNPNTVVTVTDTVYPFKILQIMCMSVQIAVDHVDPVRTVTTHVRTVVVHRCSVCLPTIITVLKRRMGI